MVVTNCYHVQLPACLYIRTPHMTSMPVTSSLQIATPPQAAHTNERLVEAARYALLRRLAPAIRHDVAGALQPLGMMAMMLEKRLQKTEPDLPAIAKNGSAIGTLAREASSACMELITWLAPKPGEVVSASAAVGESLQLLSTELLLRGFTVVNAAEAVGAGLPRTAMRQVFCACLVALTDEAEAPANVLLTTRESAGDVLLAIVIESAPGDRPEPVSQAYRPLYREDVQLLAQAEGVGLAWTPDGAELRFQRQQGEP